MSGNKVFKEYIKIYKDYLEKDLESDTAYIINWYKNSTEKNRTPEMFKLYLINSEIYQSYIYNKINNIFSKLTTINLSNDFVKKFIGYLKDTQITDEKIYSYILKSDIYKEYNTNLIELFYKYLTGKDIRPEITDKYMEYFTNKIYSFELLHKQIVEDEKLKDDKIQQIKDQHLELKGYPADLKTILNILSTLKNNENVIKSLIINDNLFDNKILYSFINIYTNTYNRDIHVLEFIKYYPKLCIGMKGMNEEELLTAIKNLFDIHIKKYSIVKSLYNNYINSVLDEKTFIIKYNKLIDIDGYENTIINELIDKTEYFDLMNKRISDLFKETYSKNISDFDLNYTYNIFKQKKYNLKEEAISQEIINITDLTKKYSEELSEIYQNILKRTPDKREYQKYITKYRNDDDFKETNKFIENELLDSLEYQMVLKEKISQKYTDIYNEQAIPSIIFMVLREIIDNNQICKKNEVELENLIKKIVEDTQNE